jgi:ubiquinone/menaquinone biosynthesis C-methylase UbiE
MADLTRETDVREAVRERYAAAAIAVSGGCCGDTASSTAEGARSCGDGLYDDDSRSLAGESAVAASLGCGNPTAVAELRAGETVLDLGSGGGADAFVSARGVGPTGTVYGLDMTDEMLELAARNASEAGVTNVEWMKGYIEDIPLPSDSVDVVISNCVINLSADKGRVIREAARVLRPGGRFAVTDIVADADMDEATRRDLGQWTGCVAGAVTRDEYARHLSEAGLEDIEIRKMHRVHRSAGSAVIRAVKPRA